MEKCKRNGILCVFALVCVAILLSTSLIVLAGNGNDSNRSTSSYKLEGCMHVDRDRNIVAVYDESQEFVGEKERLGERIASNNEIDVGGLTYETHDDYELSVVDYEGSYRNIVVPDVVLYDGKTWFVTEIADWGLSTHSPFGRHPRSVEIGASIESLGDSSLSDDYCAGDELTKFEIRKIEESRLATIGEEAFRETSIKSIELPKNLRTIEKKAFIMCGVESVILHSEILDIGDEAFFYARDLSQINLEKVGNIGVNAFFFTKLTSLDLSSATEIGDGAFVCEDLSYVKFSTGLTSIESRSIEGADTMSCGLVIHFDFYDTHYEEIELCAENMRGKSFEKGDSDYALVMIP